MKFLVIQQKMIGDVLACTVVCESLKHYFPEADVHLVANENTLPVLTENPYIDEIIVFKNEYRQNKKKFFYFLRSIRKNSYSATLDAYGKLESNLITLFSRADKKIGNFKWYTSWVYSNTIRQKKHADGEIPLSISNRLMLLNPLVKENTYTTYPKIFLDPKEIGAAKEAISTTLGQQRSKLIMVSILGSAPHKTYPASYMAQLLDKICEAGDVDLLFNYMPKQKNQAFAIYELCNEHTQRYIALDFYAESLRDFIALLSQCDVIVGNEGGAINMAKALQVPSFCIFSPFINKYSWHGGMYKNHDCIHLSDYYPELFKGKTRSELKKNSATLYQAYKPELFEESMLTFLKQQKVISSN